MLEKIKLTYLAVSFSFVVFPLLFAEAREIRKITPPKLDVAHLGPRILCHRPMRHGSPKLNVEQRYDKVIANNYGHGGSGWTLAPGSADYVNNLLINSKYRSDLKSNTPITIIGGGVIGLFTAYDLFTKGYTNLTIVAESFDALTSHNSGGLVAPVSMDNDSEIKSIIYKIGFKAYKFYKVIADKRHPHFADGAVVLPTYFENRDDSGLEPYVGVVMEPAKDVVLDFGNGTTRYMVAYDDVIFVDVSKMMTALADYLKKNKVRFIKKKIHSFSQIRDKFIVNCTGIGAKELSSDDKMLSVQGHLIMLKNQKVADLQHMIFVYFKEKATKSGQKLTRSFYIFPKHLSNSGVNDVGVIGATFIEGATSLTPNQEEFDIVLKNAKEFYGLK